jgi:sigma-B regulation protein RsbU (phosphoserine phosphatase)
MLTSDARFPWPSPPPCSLGASTKTARILIVDDEPDLELLIRQRFRQQIRERVYNFVFARDGDQALDHVCRDPLIELVLTDIRMPGMDGLTLLGRLQELNPLLHTVVVSAYGDMANIRTAMNRGAFDFLTKPIDFQDFETTILKSLYHARAQKQAAEAREQLAMMQREMSFAANVQQTMLPRNFAHALEGRGIDIYGSMLPARNVGGDFYDFFFLDPERLGFVIGDVSGKGMPAALFMMMCMTLLKAGARRHSQPGECLTEVNRLLCGSHHSDLFVTLFYGILDLRTGRLCYSNGAHNLPYLLRPEGATMLEAEREGGVVGLFEHMNYDTVETRLSPGDGLFLYTDGVNEACNGEHDRFGTEQLEAFLARSSTLSPREIVQGSIEAVRAFALAATQSDDLTVLALRYHGSV